MAPHLLLSMPFRACVVVFRGMLHNEVAYVFRNAFKEAGFKSVGDEPELQALS